MRIPHFIDENHVPCAVGHLMIENGFQEDAYALRDSDNLIYMRDISPSVIAGWANESTLSIDEMAWIQPGYPPSQTWTSLGQNMDGILYGLIVWNDEVYVGGEFLLNGVPTCIAKIVNDNVVSVDFAPAGTVRDLEIYNGNLYAAGNFDGLQNVFIYDGTDASLQTVGESKYPFGYKFYVDDEILYLSTDGSGIIQMSTLYLYSGTWQPIAYTDLPIWDMKSYDGELVVGGEFSYVQSPLGEFVEANNLATWDGAEWSAEEGVSETVRSITQFGDSLLVAGNVKNEQDSVVFGSGVWFNDEFELHTWNSFVYIITDTLEFFGHGQIGQNQLIWGDFDAFPVIGTFGSNLGIVSYTNGNGYVTPIFPSSNGGVRTVLEHEGKVYAGGDFAASSIGGIELDLEILVVSDDVVSIATPPEPEKLVIFPNPSNGIVQIEAADITSPAMIQILDQSGRLVHEESSTPLNQSFDFSHLANGKYFVSVLVDGAPVAVKAIVLK